MSDNNYSDLELEMPKAGFESTPHSLQQAREMRQRLHGRKLKQPQEAVALVKALERDLGVPLHLLHQHFGPYPLFELGSDSNTPLHKKLYQLHHHLNELYQALCSRVIIDLIGEPCYVQAIPCYRFGLPNNRWVGGFHHDSDFGHNGWELNAICAFTPAHKTAALQVEKEIGDGNFEPLQLEAGEVVMFDHIERFHGCVLNQEEHSVASIDFRFVPERFASDAFKHAEHSINTKTPMIPGGYFSKEAMVANT